MPAEQLIQFMMQTMIWRAPILLIVLIGLVVSIMQLKKCPAPAILAVTALTIMLFSQFLGFGLTAWQVSNSGPMSNRTMMSVFSFVNSLMFAASIGVLILAVFKNRRPPNYE